MDLKQIKALVTVAEVGSVTRASEILHLVQPAVSRQIRTLEQELGVALFERTRQGMRVTDSGALMVERARRALNELERARAELAPTPGFVTGVATLGLLESATGLLAERLVTTLARDHPGVDLRLMTAYSGYLQQWLDDGDLDLSLLYNLTGAPPFNTKPLVKEGLWVAAPPSVGLRGDRPVSMAEVVAHPLVLPASGHALRTLIDGAAAKVQAEMDVVVQTNSMRVQKRLVLGGHSWTILPGVGIADEVAEGTLSAAPLCEPEVPRAIVLGSQRTGRTSPAVDVVARTLTELIRSEVQEGRWLDAEFVG